MSPAASGVPMARPRRQRGFTLIELLVGIALVAVVLALVAPSMRDLMAAQRVSAINAELVTDLQFARSEAVRRSRPVFVEFRSSPDWTCYVIYIAGAATCNCLRGVGRACGLASPQEIKTVLLPRTSDVSLAASSGLGGVISFQPDNGLADPADFRVEVAGAQRGLLRTSTNMTGRPAVCSPDGSISQVPRCPE